jgi:hypothetical protein
VADVLSLLAENMPECPHLEFILRWLHLLCIKHGPALQVCSMVMLEVDPSQLQPSCYWLCTALGFEGQANPWIAEAASIIRDCHDIPC